MINELIINHSWFLYTAIALFSLAVGSLLNVIIYRLPIMLQEEWNHEYHAFINSQDVEKEHRKLNLFLPRSFCPSCNTMIKAWQNIPILSYLFLGGRCSYCQAPISLRYPLLEAGTMLLSLYASWHFGFTWQLPFALIALWILICLFFIDLDHQLLPDNLTLTLLWTGLVANTQHLFTQLPDAVLSAVGAYIGLWLFIKLFYLLTGKIGMGHGDFKLFAAFGAWFGWKFLPLILLFSSITGTLFGFVYLYLRQQSKDTPIAFGPFLCTSGLITLFWGDQLLEWYLHLWF